MPCPMAAFISGEDPARDEGLPQRHRDPLHFDSRGGAAEFHAGIHLAQ